ncbi:MAG TPA: hypothetical protein VI953_00335 [Candidatus Paceibacterota bacterium]
MHPLQEGPQADVFLETLEKNGRSVCVDINPVDGFVPTGPHDNPTEFGQIFEGSVPLRLDADEEDGDIRPSDEGTLPRFIREKLPGSLRQICGSKCRCVLGAEGLTLRTDEDGDNALATWPLGKPDVEKRMRVERTDLVHASLL